MGGWPPEILAVGASAAWAGANLFSAAAAGRMGALAFTRWRLGFAALGLLVLVLAGGGFSSLLPRHLAWLGLSAVVGLVIGDTALFACMVRLGPRRAGILFATHALFSAFLALWFLGEHLSWPALGGGLLLVAGVMVAIASRPRDGGPQPLEAIRGQVWVGVALGLVAALSQAVGVLVLKPVMTQGVDPVAASAVRMAAGLLGHLALRAAGWPGTQPQAPLRWRDLARTAVSAALGLVLGMTLVLEALRLGSAARVGMLSALSPVLLLPLLWWHTGRRPAAAAWAGAWMAVTGAAALILARSSP